MTAVESCEAAALRAALALPPSVQRAIVRRPVVRDGQTLAVDVQLMLLLQRVTREPEIGDLPVPESRLLGRRLTRLTAGKQPIGAVRDLTVAGLPARLYTPTALVEEVAQQPSRDPLLLFFHGGGFFFGDLETHDAACRFLAERSGVRLLAIDYRLGPEHRFPAAYDDAMAAYSWVVEHVDELGADPARLAVGGDSAGGNLAALVAIEAARSGLPLAFQLLIYPMTDADRATASAELFAEGFFLTRSFIDLADASYLSSGDDRSDPRMSPLQVDLPSGVAPAYVATAGFDPLRDEGEAYARKLAEAGTPVELCRYADQMHGFLNVVGVGRSSRAAVAQIAVKLGAALT